MWHISIQATLVFTACHILALEGNKVLGAQLPLSPPSHFNESPASASPPGILDDAFDDWLTNLTSFWGMKGLSIAVVKRKDDGKWDVETKGYGVKNEAGSAVTEDVSCFQRVLLSLLTSSWFRPTRPDHVRNRFELEAIHDSRSRYTRGGRSYDSA